MIQVYHLEAIDPNARRRTLPSVRDTSVACHIWLNRVEGWAYRLVALMDGEDLERAYQQTNNIDQAWTKNADVLSCIGDRARSTSVGDVIVKGDPRKGWEVHLVSSFGFKLIHTH